MGDKQNLTMFEDVVRLSLLDLHVILRLCYILCFEFVYCCLIELLML